MIIYENTKSGFIKDVNTGYIADMIEDSFKKLNLSHSNISEHRSWANSLMYMRLALEDKDIDEECKLAIEYQIPLTSKRVDFLIAGRDELGNNNIVVIELKQWENCKPTQRPEIVLAYTGGAERAVCHPSYQAYSYAIIIENYNEEVEKESITLRPCAYLHNFKEENRENIEHENYKEALKLAPVFLSHDIDNLSNFIKTYIK